MSVTWGGRGSTVASFAFVAVVSATPRAAAAGEPPRAPAPLSALETRPDSERPEAYSPGYFNGIGTTGRYWEMASDTAFGSGRVFTQRVDLARALTLRGPLALIVRASLGADGGVDRGPSVLQGPIFALGLRDHSATGDYAVEFGVRLIPSWSGPADYDPSSLQLALEATLTSGIADDARWLSFSDTGFQIYGSFESRTRTLDLRWLALWLGARYGGEASLLPMKVRSWLGPQTGFIGNVFLEVVLAAPSIAGTDANIEIGGHAEVSLSSIWPSDDAFPFIGNGFVGWSPKSWLSLRVFTGVALLPTAGRSPDAEYGSRLAFYLP